jgi:large subunit ribosomal protein L12
MEYVYGALLLNAAGKPIDEAGLGKVLTAAGISPDAARVKSLIASLEGVDLKDLIAKAETVSVAAPAPAPAESKGGKGEKKEEEKKEEKGVSEEEAAEGLSALFG